MIPFPFTFTVLYCTQVQSHYVRNVQYSSAMSLHVMQYLMVLRRLFSFFPHFPTCSNTTFLVVVAVVDFSVVVVCC